MTTSQTTQQLPWRHFCSIVTFTCLSSGQAVVIGVFPSSPLYVPLFVIAQIVRHSQSSSIGIEQCTASTTWVWIKRTRRLDTTRITSTSHLRRRSRLRPSRPEPCRWVSCGRTPALEAAFGCFPMAAGDPAFTRRTDGLAFYTRVPFSMFTPASGRSNGHMPCGFVTNTGCGTPYMACYSSGA